MLRRILKGLGILLLVVIVGGAAFVASRQNLTFEAPYPDVVASPDSAIVERGHDDRALLPFQEMQGVSDIENASYPVSLKSMQLVKNDVGPPVVNVGAP